MAERARPGVRASGTYREVDPPHRFVIATKNRDGEEQTNRTTFTAESGRTTVTVSIIFASKTSRDRGLPYAKIGTDPNYARLDSYLASKRSPQPTHRR